MISRRELMTALLTVDHLYTIKYPLRQITRENSKGFTSFKYCLETVRKYDNENFICTLLLKDKIRSQALTIRAFNTEIARVQDLVSDPNIGRMRFKFWEDSLNDVFSNDPNRKVPTNPVIQELHKTTKYSKLSKQYFQRLITSRRQFLENNFFENMESLETYAEQSVSSVNYLILECAGIRNINADHAASHLGKAQGLVNMLRSIPHAAINNTVILPRELLAFHHVSEEQILRGISSARLNDVVFDVASRAHQHLKKARSLKSSVPEEAKAILLTSVFIDAHLKRFKKYDFDIFNRLFMTPIPFVQFKLWWNKFRSNY